MPTTSGEARKITVSVEYSSSIKPLSVDSVRVIAGIVGENHVKFNLIAAHILPIQDQQPSKFTAAAIGHWVLSLDAAKELRDQLEEAIKVTEAELESRATVERHGDQPTVEKSHDDEA